MPVHSSLPPAHLALVVLISLAWGGNFLASAVALLSLPPFLYTALRLAIVLVILAPWLRAPAPGHWPRLIAVALLNGSLHFGINFWALRAAGDLSSVAIGLQTHVPISVILSVWLLGERISKTTVIAVAVSFVGVLVMGLDPGVADQPLALALCLLAAFALALGSTLMRRLAGVGVFSLQAWGAVFGIPLMLVVSALLEGDPRAHLAAAPLVAYGGAAFSAIAASILGHGGYYWLVQRHGVSPVSPYTLMTPLFAVLLGVLVWGDRPGPRLAIGGALVLGGVLLIALRRRAPPRT